MPFPVTSSERNGEDHDPRIPCGRVLCAKQNCRAAKAHRTNRRAFRPGLPLQRQARSRNPVAVPRCRRSHGPATLPNRRREPQLPKQRGLRYPRRPNQHLTINTIVEVFHPTRLKDKPRRTAPVVPQRRTLDTTEPSRLAPPNKPTSAGHGSSRRVAHHVPKRRVLRGHGGPVFAVSFSGDGNLLLSGSGDRTVRLWDLSTGQIQKTIALHLDTVRAVVVSADGSMLVSASLDETIRLWDLTAPTTSLWVPLKTLLSRAKVMSVAFSSDGRYLASGAQDNLVRVWDARTGDLKLELQGHDGVVASVALSPDSRYIASGSHDMTIRIWDLEGGLVDTLCDHTSCVHAVAFSPCGSRLASGSADKGVILWNTTPGVKIKRLLSLSGHTDFVWSVVFNSMGDRVASGAGDKTIMVWDVATGRRLHVFRGHEDAVVSVAFSPTAYQIASASRDRTVRIWDVEDDSQPS